MTTTIEQKFRKLDDISHVLLRPGRYLGSISPHTETSYVINEEQQKFKKQEVTWCPALLKTFDEVLSNSVDFSKTIDGKHLNTIKIEINKESGLISVFDDGGIAVVKHKEHDQWIPELIFELKAGSNFNDEDDSVLTGQNGEGAALTLIFAKHFTVSTSDGKNSFLQTHTENGRSKTDPIIKSSSKNFTKIEWLPDYEKFNLINGLDEDNYRKLVKRVYDAAGCNPNLKIYLNGSQIKIKSFEEYIKLYTEDYVYEETDNWKIGISAADDGFSHVSFVNGTNTDIGGTHIGYVMDQITSQIRAYVKKKHKVDVKPGDVRNQLNVFINATIVKPRYSSQTKQDLISETKDYKTSWNPSEKFINKILKSEIIEKLMDWVQAKELAQQNAELRKLNKNSDKQSIRKIIKLSDAGLANKDPEKCILFLVEGESAAMAGKSTCDRQTMGFFPLRGKPTNVNSIKLMDLLLNEEFKNIMTITGLTIGVEVKSAKDLRYGALAFMTDSDTDGAHISGLLMNMIHKFWPELFKLGLVYRFITPLIKVTAGKTVTSFNSIQEFKNWELNNPNTKFKLKYYKGLATSQSSEFKEYFQNIKDHLVRIEYVNTEDSDDINLVFGKASGMSDKRKRWLDIE